MSRRILTLLIVLSILMTGVSSKAVVLGNFVADWNEKYGEIALGAGSTVRFFTNQFQFTQALDIGSGLRIAGLEYSTDQERLAILAADSNILDPGQPVRLMLWDVKTKTLQRTLENVGRESSDGQVNSLWNYNDSLIAVPSSDSVTVLSLDQSLKSSRPATAAKLNGARSDASINGLWSPTQNILLTENYTTLTLTNMDTGKSTTSTEQSGYNNVTWSPDGKYIALTVPTADRTKIARIVNVDTQNVERMIQLGKSSGSQFWIPGFYVNSVFYVNAAGENKLTIELLEDKTFTNVMNIEGFTDLPRQVIGIEKSRFILVIGASGLIRLYDTATGKMVAETTVNATIATPKAK